MPTTFDPKKGNEMSERRVMNPVDEEKKSLKELFSNTHDVWVKDNRDGSMVGMTGAQLALLRLGLEYL
jgi:hypothetical protein